MAREFCPSVCASHSRNVAKRQNIKIFHCLAVNSVHRSISVTQNTVGEILGHRYEGNRDVLFHFTVRRLASAVYAAVVSICLSVTSRCCTETAKRRITQTTPHVR